MPEAASQLHAWAAGFIDGEAYIDAAPRNKNSLYYSPCIVVAQIVTEPLERLVDLYGGKIYTLPPRENRQQAWRWQIASAEKLRVCIPLWLPYLTVKRVQAELLLELCHLIGARGRHSAMSKDQAVRDRRAAIAQAIRDDRKVSA